MDFINHTPFPSQAFTGIDQHAQSFHVLVLRQTLSLIDGRLDYAPRQAPLCQSDQFFGEPNVTSVRQESDLCHYKPKCDIIINATAHAPLGKPVKRFPVRLVVKRPDTPAPLPERPRGLSPMQDAEPEVLARWCRQVELARQQRTPGTRLVDKILTVTGERHFKKRLWPTRLLMQMVRWAGLSLIRPIPWKLTSPGYFTSLALRNEFAYGGQSRINAVDRASEHLRKKDRLSEEQLACHPDASSTTQRPAAHAVYDCNPVGLGFSRMWELRVSRRRSIAAPRIERQDQPITANWLWRGLRTTLEVEPAGLGVRPKSHPLRRALMGTIDERFIQSEQLLPDDFDFAIWNAAPPDQQTEFLTGDEVIELTNLSPHDGAGAMRDRLGNTVLRLGLPGHVCYALVRLDDGGVFEHALSIDTVLVEPESQTLTLVWRAVLAIDPEVPIRQCEVGMRTLQEHAASRAVIDSIVQVMAAQETLVGLLPISARARS